MRNWSHVISIGALVAAIAALVLISFSPAPPDLTPYQTHQDVDATIANATKDFATTVAVNAAINAAVANRPTIKEVFGTDEIPRRIVQIDTVWEDEEHTIVSSVDTTWKSISAVELAEMKPASPVEQFVAQPEVKAAIGVPGVKKLEAVEEAVLVPKKKKLPSIFQ
jgi:hypothetical protein